jgi:hypothetical protein
MSIKIPRKIPLVHDMLTKRTPRALYIVPDEILGYKILLKRPEQPYRFLFSKYYPYRFGWDDERGRVFYGNPKHCKRILPNTWMADNYNRLDKIFATL